MTTRTRSLPVVLKFEVIGRLKNYILFCSETAKYFKIIQEANANTITPSGLVKKDVLDKI
jgi:hypothetical protein